VSAGRRGLCVLAAVGAAATLTALAVPAGATPATGTSPVKNPYSPAYGHAYRHGVTPTIAQQAKMNSWARQHPATTAAATGTQTLSYGGGVDGIGVQSGHSKVYLVFYGTQWGTQSTTNGISSFSGDANHAAEAAQNMFKGIGTNNELWSADLTQWCDGPNVANGATSCPATAKFIPY
jgi:hypothetical protein